MSGGWDDDDDDLLAMLDEDDDIISSSGGDNRVANEPQKNYQPPNNDNTTDISTLNSNPFLRNDNDDVDVDNSIVDDSMGNGWDDDDLDLSDELNISDDIKDKTTPQQPSSTLHAVPHPPPPPPPIHTNVNSNVSTAGDVSYERVNVVAMLAAHEKALNKEIDNINGIEQQQQLQSTNDQNNDDQNDVNISDEWDFDDDDADIFNEDNIDLHEGDEEDDELVPNPPLSLQPSPRAIRPSSTLNDATFQEKELSQPPPPPAAPPIQQKLEINPFLTNNSIGKDVEEPSLVNETTTYAANNGSSKDVDNGAEDADGWSDEDFFDDDDDDMLQSTSSGVPQPSTIPPPPPHPIPTQQHLSPPIAQRTRAKTASAPAQHQQQYQEQLAQPSQSLNPSQKRIHDMLSTYMSTLHNPNFLTNLHYTLHQHQSKYNVDGEGSSKSAASDLRTYYTTRPGLKKYTLGVELDRMDYKLILQNGKVINDKDVIRSYFGVSSTGERLDGDDDDEEGNEEASIEELLVRSANQSLLADMLVALTGSEDNDSSLGESGGGLILSGPTLCMTSVAESCQFKIDLSSDVVEAVCLLAISVPFHDDAAITQAKLSYHGNVDDIIKDGRLILARAQVSVRFRPGDGEEMNDEPTVQYTVQSITPYHTATSELITTAAISLALDQMDPFFHDEYADVNVDDVQMIDARDRFLLSHHLADSGLLVVSDHIDRLKDAAEHHSTGFRSALRQLDGVTNVSSKLSGIREGFGLALPSAEEIEAAEREAASSHHNIPRPPPPPPEAVFRFPRPEQVMERNVPPPPSEFRFPRPEQVAQSSKRPPPPPPPIPQQNDAPRPLIGGLFMSGLSRLAAAASQPDDNHQESGWGGGGGTGLTPPSSPGNNQAPSEMPPTLYRRDEIEHPQITQGSTTQGLTNQFQELTAIPRSGDISSTRLNDEVEKQDEEDEDAGWSDDEFDFDDDLGGNDEIEEETRVSNNEMKGDNKIQETASLTPQKPHRPFKTTIEYQEESERESFKILMAMETKPATVVQPQMAKDVEVDGHSSSRGGNHQPPIHHEPPSNHPMKAVPPPPPPLPKSNPNQPQRTFEEEFVMVLSDKISAECQEMEETGRMKRWKPISEDPILRKQLMEVMVAQLT